jgi:16S rRNA (guanine1207-N2)-methyltransferase
MSQSRLSTLFADLPFALPEGRISVLRPSATTDLSALPREAVEVVHGFKPDCDQWAAMGYRTVQAIEKSAVAVVCVPRAKDLAKAMVAEACAMAEVVIVDGGKTDGADSLFKACRQRLGDLPSIAKAHGRVFWFPATDAFADWAIGAPERGPHGFYTTAGVFSDGSVDRGSALLARSLPRKLPSRMADFGAGWGYLATKVLDHPEVMSLDLIEAEALSLDCARRNVTDPRARFHWADATQFKPEQAYTGIVMNPPFHTGRAGDPGLGRAFIANAANALVASGQLWMVANRHLPYESALTEAFREVSEIDGDAAFKVVHASRPKRRA